MIRGQLEKYLDALDCVAGGIDHEGMFTVRDKDTLVEYARVGAKQRKQLYTFVTAYDLEDPIRRTVLLDILQKYADTPINQR